MFLAPLYLIGLLSVAIPLVLHLRRSTRVKKIVFSTTRFFDEQFIKSSRRARFQDMFLMALRIALLALFVLALSQPIIGIRGLPSLLGQPRNVAIVIDDSASMALVDEHGTLLDRAKQQAIALVATLSKTKGDHATVVLAGRREGGVRVLFPELTTDFEAVRKTIDSIQPTDLATDVNSAVEKAASLLGSPGLPGQGSKPDNVGSAPGGSREVFVFSDMQETGFTPSQKVTAGPETSLVLVSVAAKESVTREQVTIEAMQYSASRPMLNIPFTFRALVTNQGDHAKSVSAKLVVAGQTVSQKNLELPPGRSKFVRFTHRFTKPEWFGGYVELGPPMAEDERTRGAASEKTEPSEAGGPLVSSPGHRRYFAVKVEDKVRLLAVNGAPSAVPLNDGLFFFRLALTVSPEAARISSGRAGSTASAVQVDETTLIGLTAEKVKDYPLIVLANSTSLPPEKVELLEKFVDAGGSLLITLGDRVDPKAYNGWIGENRLHGGLLPSPIGELVGNASGEAPGSGVPAAPGASGGKPAADAGFIASITDDHPVVAGFGDGQFGNLNAVHYYARYHLSGAPDEVIMRSSGGDPLLVERRFGRGRVMLYASSLDRRWSNFPLQATFIPWLYRTVSYLAQGGLESAGFVRTGQVVELPASSTQVEALRIETPDGGAAYPEPAQSLRPGSTTPGMVVNTVDRAGVYAVRSGAQKNDQPARLLFAANVPAEEFAPLCIDKKSAAGYADGPWSFHESSEPITDVIARREDAVRIWNYLLFGALLVGLFEPWLANRLSKRRAQKAADAMGQRDVASPTAGTARAA